MPDMTKVAFSYSHADEALRIELEKHLAALKRQGLIDTWHDRRILAGQEFDAEIDRNFEEAEVILLLVSPDFIASDYCYNVEMLRALEKHTEGSATLIPVILRPCHWHTLPFGKLLAATRDGKPVTEFPSLDAGFYQVVEAIKRALENRPKGQPVKRQDADSRDLGRSTGARLAASEERSSNLRIKRAFSDQDRDHALTHCFEYITRFFSNSLEELQRREAGVQGQMRRIDANSFEATVYMVGKRRASCGIWMDSAGRDGAIYFSHQGMTRNSYNESMSVEDDGYVLGFKPTGMAFRQAGERSLLTSQGAAEYFWAMLIDPLQQ